MRFAETNRTWLAGLAVALLVIGMGIGSQVAVSQSQTINGCVNKRTGALKIAETCTSRERKISWNVLGARGPQGPAGSTGSAGPAGPAGSNGSTGATGPAGPSNAYLSVDNSNSTPLNGSGATECHFSNFRLPAGDYVVMANANAAADNPFNNSPAQFNIQVRITSGSPSYTVYQSSLPVAGTWILDNYYGSETAIWAFEDVPAGSIVEVMCDSSSPINVTGVSVVAIKSGEVAGF